MQAPLIFIDYLNVVTNEIEYRACAFKVIDDELYCTDKNALFEGEYIDESLAAWAKSVGGKWSFVTPNCVKLIR
jgi:hypothetical protein